MPAKALDHPPTDDLALAARAAAGDRDAVRAITKRYNQSLFRAAFGILRDRAEAEEALQESYLKAFSRMRSYRGEAALGTWLTRIVINEAIARQRAARRRRAHLESRGVALLDDYREALMQGSDQRETAERAASRREIAALLEHAIEDLPEAFRLVFVLHEVDDVSVSEIAAILQAPPETVRTRLFRARRRLRSALGPELRSALAETFVFAGADCEALTERVVAALDARQG